MYTDKIIVCKQCGREIVFSAENQRLYYERGFNDKPYLCMECLGRGKSKGKISIPAVSEEMQE